MRSRPLFALLFAVLLAPAARAGLDIDFGASVRVDDRASVYVAVSARYFERDRDQVVALGARFGDPDDLAVALFVARHSRRSPDEILVLRRQGLSWWAISVRCGVPADAWFVPVHRDPGPPYGKAYGHWKKHRGQPNTALVLTDVQARDLVAVRMLRDYYGVSAEVAMQWRSSGRALPILVSEEYQRRHEKAAAQASKGRGDGKNKKNK